VTETLHKPTVLFVCGKRYEDWELEDPAGKGIDTVRRVRDDIRVRVGTLIGEILPAGA
jgi:arsenate reductase